jgi:hypothetical protein
MKMDLQRLCREDGFTMGVVTIAAFIATTVATVALATATGDLNGSQTDLEQKAAYEAAQAGINDYAFHLNNDTGYWANCDNVPSPSAVNLAGSTTRRRAVPGGTGATYAVELLPASGETACSENDPVGTMLETGQNGPMRGTFRIRSTGYAGDSKRSVVATFKRRSFLDYVYFTQYETLDPTTYGDPDTVADASANCERWTREGRPTPGGGVPWCTVITFPDFDYIKGPFHTNDSITTCGSPTFGRDPTDVVEVGSPAPGWERLSSSCGSGTPNFQGTYVTNSPILTPPPTNASIRDEALSGGLFEGQVILFLNGNSMQVFDDGQWNNTSVPSNGVVYVANDPNLPCSEAYSPFTADYYDETSGCGNVYVAANLGGYNSPITVAAENDIIIYDDIERSGNSPGILGLIANNFVRVMHDYPNETLDDCGLDDGETRLQDLRIDAAILAINHSFIVDHYDCGEPLGELEINGAISQKFRGPVGTFNSGGGGGSSTGYTKNYNYDDRLRYLSPPYFLDPVQSAWRVQRETIDFTP